jgi:hypothetical protein
MDNTRNVSMFEKLPRIDEGPLPPAFNPDGSRHLKVAIPSAMILSKHMGLIQEGALHCIHFAPQVITCVFATEPCLVRKWYHKALHCIQFASQPPQTACKESLTCEPLVETSF